MTKRYFAIGIKGAVEIRESAEPPKLTTTTAEVMVKRERYIPREFTYKMVPMKAILKVTRAKGGNVVATIKERTFSSRTKVAVRNGGMIELLPFHVEMLKKELGNETL